MKQFLSLFLTSSYALASSEVSTGAPLIN